MSGSSKCTYIPFAAIKPEEEVSTDREKCSNGKYIRAFVMPLVKTALEQMVQAAKSEEVFKYPEKRSRFNGCDFLTEYLYNNNPRRTNEAAKTTSEIDFCQQWDKNHPRPMLPLSLRYEGLF